MIFLLVLIIFIIMGCTVNKKNKTTAVTSTIISYKKVKARCMRCPHFSIDILDNRTAIYEGKANVPVLGKHIIPLSKKQFNNITNQFEHSNFMDFEPLYLTKRRDLPRWILIYKDHKVNTQKAACPESLMKLMLLVESIKPK